MLQRVFLAASAGASVVAAALVLVLPSARTPAEAAESAGSAESLAIEGALVFDGERFIGERTVIIEDGLIAGVLEGGAPEGAEIIDADGMTLLPGLIDAHTHSWGSALQDALRFGVTTQIDMFTPPDMLPSMTEEGSEESNARASLVSAGMLATAEYGHGTQFGVPVETLDGPDEAAGWVARRIKEGSSFIKLVYMPGQDELPSIDLATATAVIEAAHAEGLMAVAHIDTLRAARDLLEAGVDAFVHVFGDQEVDEDFIASAKKAGVFVIPTLSVIASADGEDPGAVALGSEEVRGRLSQQQQGTLAQRFPQELSGYSFDLALHNTAALFRAGVPILAGTDAPNPGTAYGVSMERELTFLTVAGLSTEEALRAATRLPAAIFGLEDRGRIEEGARADLLLVRGDLHDDMAQILATEAVFKGGHKLAELGIGRAQPVQNREAPPVLGSFDDRAADGVTWTTTADDMMNGQSSASVATVEREGGGGYLLVETEIAQGFPFPWGGAMVMFSPDFSTKVDMSGYDRLTFEVKGTPGTYRAMLFAGSMEGIPPTVEFEVTEDWRAVEIELASFRSDALDDVGGLALVAGPALGTYRVGFDEVRLER